MIWWTMAVKDIKQMIRDRKALIITLLMPAVLTVILGFSVGRFIGGDINLTPAQVGIVRSGDFLSDQTRLSEVIESPSATIENSEISISHLTDNLDQLNFEQMLLSEVFDLPDVRKFIHYQEYSKDQALEKLSRGELTSVIIFPEQFNFQMWMSFITSAGAEITIELIQNPDQQIKSTIVQSILEIYTDMLSAAFKGRDVLLQSAIESGAGFSVINQIDVFIDQISAGSQTIPELVPSGIEGRRQIQGLPYYAAGMGVMFMMFSAAFGASYTLREKQQHTMNRLLISGRSLPEMMAGRFTATCIFVFLQLSLLIAATVVFFSVTWGNYGHIILITIAASLTIGALTVLLSVITLICNDEKINGLFQSVIVPLFSLLGGSFVSTTFMPETMQAIGRVTPNGAAMQGYLKVLQGYSPTEMPAVFAALAVNALIFSGVALWLSKRMEAGQ